MVLLALVAPSFASTLVVAGGGPYTSVGAAITAAASGDTISVGAGTWTECLDTAGKDLTIEGAGLASTTLTASAACESGLVIDGGETVVLADLTVTHPYYRAITVTGSTLALRSVKVANSGSYSYNGGGISASAAAITAVDSVFSGNSAGSGGAIYAVGNTTVALTDTELTAPCDAVPVWRGVPRSRPGTPIATTAPLWVALDQALAVLACGVEVAQPPSLDEVGTGWREAATAVELVEALARAASGATAVGVVRVETPGGVRLRSVLVKSPVLG